MQLASHERESVTRALDSLQKQHDELQAQQSHWEDLRQASEKIDILTNLIGQADNEELLELRRYREQSRMLEADYNNLQKRFKELENKFGTSERSVGTTKQNLAQAQQKVVEWERRAKESEGLVETLQTKLDQAEQTHAQLDADHSLVKLQLEEREAEYRAIKVCVIIMWMLYNFLTSLDFRIAKRDRVIRLPLLRTRSGRCKLSSRRELPLPRLSQNLLVHPAIALLLLPMAIQMVLSAQILVRA